MRFERAATRARISGALLLAGGLFAILTAVRIWSYLGAAPLATLPEVVRGAAPVPTLLFIFDSHDCRTYARLVERWNDLHTTGELRVRGVALDEPGPGEDVERDFRDRLRFPLRPELVDRAERLMLRLGHTRTPLSVLLDAEGRPRLVIPPESDRERVDRALAMVRAHAAFLSLDPEAS